jgi:hypothetical protein
MRMNAAPSQPAPVRVFISYASRDEKLLEKLKTALSILRHDRLIEEVWDGREIRAGDDWEKVIADHINKAQVILLLLSFNFFASEYCGVESKLAMERYNKGEALVIPIILHRLPSEQSFGKLQCLPTNKKPVTDWPNPDAALSNVVEGIREAVKAFIARPRQTEASGTASAKAEAAAAPVNTSDTAPRPPAGPTGVPRHAVTAPRYVLAAAAIVAAVAFIAWLFYVPDAPSIRINEVPPYDEDGGAETSGRIAGEVSGVHPEDYRVVIYSLTRATWYVQPTEAEPLTPIAPGRQWAADIHTGTRYAALLVRPDFNPRGRTSTHPARLDGVVASAEVGGMR